MKLVPFVRPLGGGTIAIFAALLISCSAPEPGAPPDRSPSTSQEPSPRLQELLIGVGTHLMGGSRPVQRSLDAVSDTGATSFRDDAAWAAVEREKGVLEIPAHWDVVVNEAVARGIAPLLILDYGNRFYDSGDKPRSPEAIAAFVRYAQFVVSHFQGRVAYYEIWNEWDHTLGGTSPGTAEEYVELVRNVYPAIRKADPTAEILVGSMTSSGVRGRFLRRILELGVLDFADGLSLHTYVHCGALSRPEDWAEWMRDVENGLTQLLGKAQPFYITEMGWPSHTGECGRSAQQQADYLARLYLLAQTLPFVQGIWWYDLQDDGPDSLDPQHNFGLLRTDFSTKPAFTALREIAELIQRSEFAGPVETGYPNLRALRFRADAGDTVAFWSDTEDRCFHLRNVSAESGGTYVPVSSSPKLTRGYNVQDGTTVVTQVHCGSGSEAGGADAGASQM